MLHHYIVQTVRQCITYDMGWRAPSETSNIYVEKSFDQWRSKQPGLSCLPRNKASGLSGRSHASTTIESMLCVGSSQSLGFRSHSCAFISASVTSRPLILPRPALYNRSNLGQASVGPCYCCAPSKASLQVKEDFADFGSSSQRASRKCRGGLHCSKYRRKSRNQCSPLQAHKKKNSGKAGDRPLGITSDKDVEATYSGLDDTQGLEAGVIPESRLLAEDPSSTSAQASTSGRLPYGGSSGSILYPPAQQNHIRESWCSSLFFSIRLDCKWPDFLNLQTSQSL